MKTRLVLAGVLLATAIPAASVAADENGQTEFKFAYVQMEKVLADYVLFGEAKDEARAKIKDEQIVDRQKLNEYQADIDALEKKLAGPLTPEAKAEAEDAYRQGVQEALDFRDSLVTKYKKLEQDTFAPVWEKVYEKVASYAEKNDYDVVFDYSALLLYAGEKYDITEDVITELNEEAGVSE